MAGKRKGKPLAQMTPEELKEYNREKAIRCYRKKALSRNIRGAVLQHRGRRHHKAGIKQLEAAGIDRSLYVAKSLRLPLGLIQRLNNAAAALQGPPLNYDQTAIVERALEIYLQILETQHNEGAPFPQFVPRKRPTAKAALKKKQVALKRLKAQPEAQPD